MSDPEEQEKPTTEPVPEEAVTDGEQAPEGSQDDVSKNFMEREDDPLERAQKEGGEEAEFDLEAQITEFYQQIEEDPDNCVHYYNLGRRWMRPVTTRGPDQLRAGAGSGHQRGFSCHHPFRAGQSVFRATVVGNPVGGGQKLGRPALCPQTGRPDHPGAWRRLRSAHRSF